MKSEFATIVANGQERQIELPCSVEDFLRICGWRPTQVVVEHNGNVLSRGTVANVQLKDGDCLEVIQPVAGG
jgi:thiamine biosynthesis protein ThiS